MSAAPYTGGQAFGAGLRDARLADAALLETLQTYKRRVAGTYRALPPARLGELSAAPMWVTRKIDGETWFLVRQSGQVFLASPSGRVLAGDLPILKQAAKLPEGSIVAGELYARVPDRRERVGDLAAAQNWPLPPGRPATGKRVLIVGAWPSGLTAGYHLARLGHAGQGNEGGAQGDQGIELLGLGHLLQCQGDFQGAGHGHDVILNTLRAQGVLRSFEKGVGQFVVEARLDDEDASGVVQDWSSPSMSRQPTMRRP
jgi:hypothetical protein